MTEKPETDRAATHLELGAAGWSAPEPLPAPPPPPRLPLRVSPDSRRIVTSSADRTARLWNAANGEHQLTLRGHTDQVWSAAFSASGHLIATASWDQTARIWNGSGQTVTVLQGHTDSLWRAAFSPDDSFLVTASDDKTARIWDPKTGQNVLTINGHQGPVFSVAYSPDGTRVGLLMANEPEFVPLKFAIARAGGCSFA